MRWQPWLFYVVTEAVLSVTPGPAVLFVLSQAVRHGAAKSVWANAGILSSNGLYFALSATSLGAIIVSSYNLFFFIKWVGAAYLIYLGLRSLFGKHASLKLLELNRPELNRAEVSNWRIWKDGVLLQLANPKALLFFTAVVPQFIDTSQTLWLQVLILGVSSTIVEFCVLLAYGQLAGRAWSAARNPRFEIVTNRVAGSLLIGAGLGLARLKRV